MMTVRVCGLCLITLSLLPSCVADPQTREVSTLQTPMQFEGGLVRLPVSINGAAPQPFIVDTGLNSLILSQVYAEEAGALSSGKTIDLRGVSGAITPVDLVRNVLVEVGGLQWALSGAMVAPISLSQPIEETTGQPFYGILGAPLFEQYAVTLNFHTQQIQFNPARSFQYNGPGEVLKLFFEGRKPYIKTTLQMTAESQPIEGKFLLDLGSNQSLDLRGKLNSSVTAGLPRRITAGLGGQSQQPVGRIHAIALGDYPVSNPITSFESSQNIPEGKVSGRIGTQILSQFKLIFNYAKRQVIFEPLLPRSQPFTTDMSGMRVVLEDLAAEPRVIVNHVYPNTPAQEAGIQPGDRLLSIDGQRVEALTLPDIRARFIDQPSTPKTLHIQRGNMTLQIQIRLRPLI